MNVINQLLENEKFSPTERVIVDYILDHRDEISHLTIHELALKTASSNPESMKQQPFTVEPSPICMYPPAPAPQKAESQR